MAKITTINSAEFWPSNYMIVCYFSTGLLPPAILSAHQLQGWVQVSTGETHFVPCVVSFPNFLPSFKGYQVHVASKHRERPDWGCWRLHELPNEIIPLSNILTGKSFKGKFSQTSSFFWSSLFGRFAEDRRCQRCELQLGFEHSKR